MSYFGIHMSEVASPLDTRLTPGREVRLDLSALLVCPDDAQACRFSEGPTWRIVVTGRAGGNEFTAPIELLLPADATSPVVRRERVRVTRAASSAPPGRIPATFKANVVIVSATINGHDLALLLDTGAQLCMLSPEAAKLVGVSALADGPVLPLIGLLGAPGNARVVHLPAVRVGDYIVEHLTGVITSLAGFPIPIDGVLGANFIAAFRVGIDHRAKELRLEPD
jgi:Aspartyl protease